MVHFHRFAGQAARGYFQGEAASPFRRGDALVTSYRRIGDEEWLPAPENAESRRYS